MGEKTQFKAGDKAPNNGLYVEVSEQRHAGSPTENQIVRLERGERFPDTGNKDRKWTHKKN